MRLRVRHKTTYRYEQPVAYAIQELRLAPRPYEGFSVISWLVSRDGRRELPRIVDGLGNIVHTHTVRHPHRHYTITVTGEVETSDTGGVVRGAPEPLPPLFFLRSTGLTAIDETIADFAATVARGSLLRDRLHALMHAIGERVAYRAGVTHVATTAAETLAGGAGVCQDHAHLFIAAARALGVPARYVGGYLWTGEDEREYEASHAWAEAFLPEIGWIGFDPSNRVRPNERYIRAAIGLDYWGAAPVRGIRRGDGQESLAVEVQVRQSSAQQ